MTENKNWKQADNEVVLTGILVENNLEEREFDVYENGQATGAKRKAIAGDIVLRTGENENHTIRLRQYEFTNSGSANKLHAGLVTIMNETVSVVDSESNPELKPSKLKVTGEMKLNEYAGQDGKIRSFPMIQGTFVNRLGSGDESETKAEFDLEGMVQKVSDEVNKDGATGRKKVSLLVPLYNSVIPLEFVVDEGNGADYIEENFSKGSSVRIYGEMVNFRKVNKKEVEMGFGENKVEETVTFVNELLIKGGSLYDEDITPAKIFSTELIKEKMVDREKYLEGLTTRSQNKKTKEKNGFGNTTATETNNLKPNGAPNIDFIF